jgi:hypothetical protein
LTVAGTGLNFEDSFISPSGLWQMDAGIIATFDKINTLGIYRYEMDNFGTATFLGHPDHPVLIAEMYHDVKDALPGLSDGNSFHLEKFPTVNYLVGWNGLLHLA